MTKTKLKISTLLTFLYKQNHKPKMLLLFTAWMDPSFFFFNYSIIPTIIENTIGFNKIYVNWK